MGSERKSMRKRGRGREKCWKSMESERSKSMRKGVRGRNKEGNLWEVKGNL
jgi:hypothetical protein